MHAPTTSAYVRVVSAERFWRTGAVWAFVLTFGASSARRQQRRSSHVQQKAVRVICNVGSSRHNVDGRYQADAVLRVHVLTILEHRSSTRDGNVLERSTVHFVEPVDQLTQFTN